MRQAGSLDPLVRAIEAYRGNAAGLAKIIDAAGRVGVLELERAVLSLRKLVGAESKGVNASRFAAKAPKVYPSKGEVVGDLLANLSLSQNLNVQALAAELAVSWFKGVAEVVKILGRPQ